MIEYREIDGSEIKGVAKMAAEAFGEYPMYTLTLRDKFKKREDFIQYMAKLNEVHIRANAKKHICFIGLINGEIVSVALLQNPKIKRISLWDYISSGGIRLLFPVGFKRLLDFFRISNKAHEACKKECKEAWYVELLAVSREGKGKGLGSKMISDCLIPYANSKGGKEIALITNTEGNCRFYEKNSFRMFSCDALTYKDKRISNWSFAREL